MSLLRRIVTQLRRSANLLHQSRVDREIDAELKAHIEMRTEDNLAAGMSPDEARRDARLRFGNATVMQERTTAADTSPLLAGIGRDVHYAFRQLRHSPGFALTAILTLALGIGANVVVLSVLNALILHPLDLPHADRMYTVEQKHQGDVNQSYPDYLDYRARNTALTDMAAYRLMAAGVSAEGSAKMSWGYEASGSYFDVLGIQPTLGRFFHASDEHGPNSAPYIVLSDAFWRSRFHADPHFVGTTFDLNKHPFTVIGVAPAGFHGTETFLWPDFWIPILNAGQIGYSPNDMNNRGVHNLLVLGRLKPGVTPQQADEDLNAVAGQLAKQYPATDAGMGARLVKPGLIGDLFGDATRSFLFGILLLSFLVLLAACANLASIFAARAADRSRELAIRLAIGSSRWHILRQLLTEAVLISLAGGIVGTAFATVLLRLLTRWQPFSDFPIHVTVTADIRVYGFALLLSLASGLLFGMLPARQVWRTDAARVIRGTAAPVLFRRFTLRDLLLGMQIALCTLLVTASLVALRGMQRSLRAPIGFQPQGAMLATTDTLTAGYSNDAALPLQKRMLQEAPTIPGVAAAGTVDTPPLSGSVSTTTIYRDGTAEFGVSHGALGAKYFHISPGYLQAAQTRLMTGRDFTWQDDVKSPKVAIINQIFAHKLFGNASAIGQHFMTGKDSRVEIVGVVEAGKYDSLTEDPWPAVFYPLPQATNSRTILVLRSQLPPADAAKALNHILTSIDPALPVSIESWPASLGLVLFPARVAAASLGIMGLLAAMLAITGTFGVAAYSVSKRMRELGIRVALGAHRAQLIRSALGRPLVLLTSGSIVGLVLGMLVSRFLAQIVYHATSRDPLVMGGVVATMALIGLVATWIPARHALSVDPARLLREE
jgi:predicted permease